MTSSTARGLLETPRGLWGRCRKGRWTTLRIQLEIYIRNRIICLVANIPMKHSKKKQQQTNKKKTRYMHTSTLSCFLFLPANPPSFLDSEPGGVCARTSGEAGLEFLARVFIFDSFRGNWSLSGSILSSLTHSSSLLLTTYKWVWSPRGVPVH